MVLQFVDPRPFLPPGAHRIMVEGRPLMKRVITGRIIKRNNDLAIASFHPLPQHQVDFATFHNSLVDFLNQNGIHYEFIQP